MKIYEIKTEVRNALENLHIDEETGEIVGTELLDSAVCDARDKVANCARFIREEEAEIEAMKKAIDNIKARMESRKKSVEWLKGAVLSALSVVGGKVEEADIRVSTRKSKSVEIENFDLLPEMFKFEKKTLVADKALIKKALEAGEVKGARLVENLNLAIK